MIYLRIMTLVACRSQFDGGAPLTLRTAVHVINVALDCVIEGLLLTFLYWRTFFLAKRKEN
jgi:hypothetical protein